MSLAAVLFAALAAALAVLLYVTHRRAGAAMRSSLAQWEEDHRALERRAAEARDAVEAAAARLRSLQGELDGAHAQCEACRSELDAEQTQRHALRDELAAARAVALAREAELYRLRAFAEERTRLLQEVAGARAECARYRQILVEVEDQAPPPILAGGYDDLKMIVGVGPVLERLLHQMGVTTFRQIAGWSDRDIDAFDLRLEEFHGRVRRDDWVTQARELHYQKFGERLGMRK